MLICFHAGSEAKSALDSILVRGQFRDISEAISTALVNYNILAQAIAEGGQIFPAASEARAIHPAAFQVPAAGTEPQETPASAAAAGVPAAFRLRAGEAGQIALLETPPPTGSADGLTPAGWLFGQFNKFLPVKASCRALYNLLLVGPSGTSVAEACNKISYAACQLGDYLQRLDRSAQSKREDAFAAAFPTSATAEGGGESRLRFGNQFVAHIRQGQLAGFPAALRLVAMEKGRERRLCLTRAGAEFAAMENPVLDGTGPQPGRKLSQAEVEFLLSHIAGSVPEEAAAYKAVLDAIQAASNTPDAVDRFLRDRFNLRTEKAMSQTFLTTQRTGAVSRLTDLGLISREKQGLRVTYHATDAGRAFRERIR
jgi:hypothetical protein